MSLITKSAVATTSEKSQSSVSSSTSTHVASYCENKVYIKKFTPGSTKISNETVNFLRKVQILFTIFCTLLLYFHKIETELQYRLRNNHSHK